MRSASRSGSHTVDERALDRDLLEVGRAPVEEELELAVVDGDLDDGGAQRPEPERDAASPLDEAAAPVAQDVARRLGAEVSHEGIAADLGHFRPPLRRFPPCSRKPYQSLRL